MKNILLSSILFFISLSVNAQTKKEHFQDALKIINSDYAKELFPETILKVKKVKNNSDTLYVVSYKGFRLLQLVQKRMGNLNRKRTLQLFDWLSHDLNYSKDDYKLLTLVKNQKPFIIKYAGTKKYFNPRPLEINIQKEEEVQNLIDGFFKNKYPISSFKHMENYFENSPNAGKNWITYFKGTPKEKQLVKAYTFIKLTDIYTHTDNFDGYKSFIRKYEVNLIETDNYKENKLLFKTLMQDFYKKYRIGLNHIIEKL